MNIMYKCQFCGKLYDWYDGLYQNPKYNSGEAYRVRRKGEEYGEKSGVFINVNSFVLKRFEPLPERDGEMFGLKEADGNLEGAVINLCPDCMRKILDNLKFEDDCNAWETV